MKQVLFWFDFFEEYNDLIMIDFREIFELAGSGF
jgi:hypothetical protein